MIRTTFIYPPIPDRSHDWCAYDDDTYCGCCDCNYPVGYGRTEAEALADLAQQMEDA